MYTVEKVVCCIVMILLCLSSCSNALTEDKMDNFDYEALYETHEVWQKNAGIDLRVPHENSIIRYLYVLHSFPNALSATPARTEDNLSTFESSRILTPMPVGIASRDAIFYLVMQFNKVKYTSMNKTYEHELATTRFFIDEYSGKLLPIYSIQCLVDNIPIDIVDSFMIGDLSDSHIENGYVTKFLDEYRDICLFIPLTDESLKKIRDGKLMHVSIESEMFTIVIDIGEEYYQPYFGDIVNGFLDAYEYGNPQSKRYLDTSILPTLKPVPTPSLYLMPEFELIEIRRGSKGQEVEALQKKLNEVGYSVGTADGEFGAKTEEQIRAYQSDHGFNVTGIADIQLQQYLYTFDPNEPASTPTPEPTRTPLSIKIATPALTPMPTPVPELKEAQKIEYIKACINEIKSGLLNPKSLQINAIYDATVCRKNRYDDDVYIIIDYSAQTKAGGYDRKEEYFSVLINSSGSMVTKDLLTFLNLVNRNDLRYPGLSIDLNTITD